MVESVAEQLHQHRVELFPMLLQSLQVHQQMHYQGQWIDAAQRFRDQFDGERPAYGCSRPEGPRHLRRACGRPVGVAGDLDQGQVVTERQAADKIAQRSLEAIKQHVGIGFPSQGRDKPFETEHLPGGVARLDEAVGESEDAVTGLDLDHAHAAVELLILYHAERQVIRWQRVDLATSAPDQHIGDTAVPDRQLAMGGVQLKQDRGEKDVGRQDHPQLVVDGGEDIADREALVGHAVKDVRHRHRADRRTQPMTGEIAEEGVQAARRLARGEHHVTVEDRHWREHVLDLRRVEAAAVDDLSQHLLRHLVLLQQATLVPRQLVALLAHGDVQPSYPLEGVDLGLEDDPAVRLGQKVVATDGDATRQRRLVAERGEEDHRHETVASLLLDLPGRLVTVEDRHHDVHQDQVRLPGNELDHRLATVLGNLDGVPLFDKDSL